LIRQNETIRIDKNGRKMFEITKKYDSLVHEFKADESSIGLPIQVYQESIDKTFTEYLVNFEYLVRLMDDYGFTLLDKDELRQMHLPESAGLFRRLFDNLENDFRKDGDLQKDYKTALNMSFQEKTVSFLNRYFIFKKTRHLSKTSLSQMQTTIHETEEEEGNRIYGEIDENENKKIDPGEIKPDRTQKNRKKVGKIKIGFTEDNYSPTTDEFHIPPPPNNTQKNVLKPKLQFDDPEIQAYYDHKISKKKLTFILSLPEKEWKMYVKLLWKKQKL